MLKDRQSVLTDSEMEEYLTVGLAEMFTKPGTANVSPTDLKKLGPLLKHYAKKKHPFTACKVDQIKHGLSEGHANRRCAVLKDIIKGGTGWREGAKGGKADTSNVELDEVVADLAYRPQSEWDDLISLSVDEVAEMVELAEEGDDEDDAGLSEDDDGSVAQDYSYGSEVGSKEYGPPGEDPENYGVESEEVDMALKPGDTVAWGRGAGTGHGIVMEVDTAEGNVIVRTAEVIDDYGPEPALSPTGKTIKVDGGTLRAVSMPIVGERGIGPEANKVNTSAEDEDEEAAEFTPPLEARRTAFEGMWNARESYPAVPAVSFAMCRGEPLTFEQVTELSEYFEDTEADGDTDLADDPEYQMRGGDAARQWVADLMLHDNDMPMRSPGRVFDDFTFQVESLLSAYRNAVRNYDDSTAKTLIGLIKHSLDKADEARGNASLSDEEYDEILEMASEAKEAVDLHQSHNQKTHGRWAKGGVSGVGKGVHSIGKSGSAGKSRKGTNSNASIAVNWSSVPTTVAEAQAKGKRDMEAKFAGRPDTASTERDVNWAMDELRPFLKDSSPSKRGYATGGLSALREKKAKIRAKASAARRANPNLSADGNSLDVGELDEVEFASGALGVKPASDLEVGEVVVIGSRTYMVDSLTDLSDAGIRFGVKGTEETFEFAEDQPVFVRSDVDMSESNENPFLDMSLQLPVDMAETKEVGPKRWLKHILPIGKINYKGRILDFSKKFHEQLVTNFKKQPFGQVPFFKVDANNRHNSDPDNFRGEVKDLVLKKDGTYAVVETNEEGTEHLTKRNPKLGTSVRVRFDFTRPADKKYFGPVLEHLAGTTLPHVPALKNWQPADMSLVDFSEQDGDTQGAGVEDLTSCSFESVSEDALKGGEAIGMDPDSPVKETDTNKEVSMSEQTQAQDIDLSQVPEELRPAFQHMMEREQRATDLAEQAMNRLKEKDRQTYVENVERRLADLSGAGVKPQKIEAARPLLLDMSYAEGEVVVDLSDDGQGGKTEVKASRSDQLWSMLENSRGEVEYGERGHGAELSGEGGSADEEALLAQWEAFRNGTEEGE